MRGSDFSEDVILVISTLSQMEMKVEVGEHEVVYVKEGDTAEIEIDAFPDRKFPAQVVEVARNATVKNAGHRGARSPPSRSGSRSPSRCPGALPGMSAQASISTDTREDAVVVPIQAVTVRTERELGAGKGDEAAAPRQGDGAGGAPGQPGKKATTRAAAEGGLRGGGRRGQGAPRSRPGSPATPRSRSSPA